MAMTLAIVHGALWGAPCVRSGRSNFKNHHSHGCKTTSVSRCKAEAPDTPPPPSCGVVVVGAL